MSDEKQAEALLSSANDTAKLVRSVHLTFMLVMAYVGIIIASTTDVQLLKVSPVVLPLLNVKLPILEFYVITPWLVLFLHFNLLIQCYLLARKLHLFNAALSKCDEEVANGMRDRLFTFALSYNIVSRQNSFLIRFFQNGMMVFSVVIVPLVLLTWAQIRFIPYHSEAITWTHRAVVLADCLLLWIVWPMIVLPEARLKQWLVCNKRRVRKLFGMQVGQSTGEKRPNFTGTGQWSVMISSFILLNISWFAAVHPGHNEDGSRQEQFFLANILFNLPGYPFRQDLHIEEKILIKSDISTKAEVALTSDQAYKRSGVLQEVMGLPLQNRDLRFATFKNCAMPKVQLQGALLHGANFSGSFLQEGNFLSAKMQGVKMVSSDLTAAVLTDANMHKGQFIYADLSSAKMDQSKMDGAIFSYANMQYADLSSSYLQGAVLASACLQRADFREAIMDGIVLDGASMMAIEIESERRDAIIKLSNNLKFKNTCRPHK